MQTSDQESTEARRYQRIFWRSALRHLPHHSAMVLTHKLRLRTAATSLSKRVEHTLKGRPLKSYPRARLDVYEESVRRTKLWHGTGRYQYEGTEALDVLRVICESGSLNPVGDVYAVLVGGKETVTISTTPLRMIARSYADIHGKGEHEPSRYGSSLWWVAYYYGIFYAQVFTRYGVTVARNWARWHQATAAKDGRRQWGLKVNSTAESVWDTFGMGSDIAGNYPVLVGIAQSGRQADIPNVLAKTEVRLVDPVRLSDISHIEVPEAKVHETERLLNEYASGIPVYPIELGEYWASRQPFVSLLGKGYKPRG